MKLLPKILLSIAIVAISGVSVVLYIISLNTSWLVLIILVAIVAMVAIILQGLVYFHLIIKPLSELNETAKLVSLGDFSKKAKVTSGDEIGQLALAFNIMADKFQELFLGLELNVKEKTSELTQKVNEIGRQKAKEEAIINSLIDGMIVTDTNGGIIMMNSLARQLLNIPTTQHILGYPIYYLTSLYQSDGNILTQEKHPIFITLSHGQKWTEDFQLNLPDGKKRILNMSATVIVEENKRIGAIAILRDITKQKEVDRMKTEFISLASHQLRTPLSAIKWFTEMLISGDGGILNNEQREFAQNISDSTERMISLVNSLLNISRIESGRIIVDPRPTKLKDLVAGVVNDLKAKTSEKQQNLVLSVHENLPIVNLDPKLISQVYMNLLTNSIKYTPKGGDINVMVSKKDDQIISQISDNGYGIPKEEHAKVFQKFFRGDNIVKVETDGTGLGLYLIKTIIESSGGRIWFQSEEGKGTTFWFSLPLSGMEAKKGEVSLDS